MLPVQKFVAVCLLQSCAVGLTLVSGGAQNAIAAEPSACPASYRSNMDARLTHAADQGPEGLRRFVTRTRMIHELDYSDAAVRVDQYRQAQKACEQQVASAK